ncbi:MAG: PAS domain S-box protein [Betaproteobacteria bacterium]|nr:PAS domain S-box protein [Betaproteobacteria bacterium]
MAISTRIGACLFEAIVNAHDEAMLTLDPEGVVCSWNGAAERLFGYAAAEAVGRKLADLLPQAREAAVTAGASPGGMGVQCLLRDRHGAWLPARLMRTDIDTVGMGGIGGAGMLLTVHASRQPRGQEPDASRAHPINVYESLVESSDDAIVTKTLAGIVTSWNPGAQRLFGYTAAEMVGESISKIIPEDRVHEEEMILQRIGAGERVEHFETVRTHKDGRPVHVSVTISPLLDARGRVVGASKIARDIGERILAEQTIWRQANQDSLTDLPNRVAHRLRELRLQGFQVAVDDFGTGASNLAALSRVEVDYLKIDRSLVCELPGDRRKLAICEAIVAMAHQLDIEVIAEGIETIEELDKIRDIRCDYAQGYLYAQPLETPRATQWLLEHCAGQAESLRD